jgi:uncharacterized lipoprotein YddW (UPF0748 family)
VALLLACLFPVFRASAQEVRGTWIARDSLGSKEALAQAMDRAASHHFNTVYVNVWSRGYPLWRSQVFFNHTGLAIDPTFSSRDILAEAVAEGHRNGLQVFAWFEYGFVGGYTGWYPGSSGKGRIFDVHPDWVARQRNGTEIDGSNFYWMAHTRPEVQEFLIQLASEVAAHYDLDGIELDRVRYSNLTYGHDPYTLSVYASEHNGAPPPVSDSDSGWIRWRADQLNAFHATLHDRIKDLYPRFIVANAPSAYSSSSYTAYNSFCQDWVWWLDNRKVDAIELQCYVSTAASFSNNLRYVATQTTNLAKISPAFALRPNNSWIAYPEILAFVDVARSGGFGCQAAWYYTDLNTSNYFPNLLDNRYTTASSPSYFPPDWRAHRRLTLVSNTSDAVRTGAWLQSANAGFTGPSFYAAGGPPALMDYYVEVPVAGLYEVYGFMVTSANRANNATWVTYDAAGTAVTNLVNQSASTNARWYKLGDRLLAPGRQHVARLSNAGVAANRYVSADALMISLNRRRSEVPTLTPSVAGEVSSNGFLLAVVGNVGQHIRIEASTNLHLWEPLTTIVLTNARATYLDAAAPSKSERVYRAALAP